jgi:hypothetical protein
VAEAHGRADSQEVMTVDERFKGPSGSGSRRSQDCHGRADRENEVDGRVVDGWTRMGTGETMDVEGARAGETLGMNSTGW